MLPPTAPATASSQGTANDPSDLFSLAALAQP